MRNQPLIPDFHEREVSDQSLIDPPSDRRFRSLAIAFVLAAMIVLGRIGWVKAKLQDRYVAALSTTSVEHEIILARDGRILSEAADVFATDVEQYSVQVHYRWLQNPVDEDWLARQIRSRLSRTERRDDIVVEHTRKALQRQRLEMWRDLAQLIGAEDAVFEKLRSAVQEKVTRIANSVNRRHIGDSTPASSTFDDDSWLLRLAARIRSSLTTAPPRGRQQRVVVREEESYHEVAADVSMEIAGVIREQAHRFPGVRAVATTRRTYPLSTVAPHIVGARTIVTEGDREATSVSPQGWTPRIGRFGVERSYDHQLRSVPGLRRVVRNRRMEIVESEVEREPVSGRDVVLTLNMPLQQQAEQLLDEALLDRPLSLLSVANDDKASAEPSRMPQPVPVGGSIVVMEVATGRVIAAASAPRFSLSLFTGASTEEWEAVYQDHRHPFLSRVISMAIPPGSVMKPLTAVAAMESGGLNPDEPFFCQGYLQRPDQHRCLIFRLYGRGHNDIALTRAIAESCNVYFFAAAQRLGFGAMRAWCDQFGLGQKTGVDLPFEKDGNVPGTRTDSAESERRFRNEALGLAIGQSSLAVTPLQMTRAMAVIANGGWLVTPHVVSPDGMARTTAELDDRPRDLTRRRISELSEDTLQRVREGLRAVVEEPYGTGHSTVRLDEVPIAGKTGTAETGGDRPDHAWFCGYFPADEPKYAFAVVLEHGGSGSRAAGPVARELVRKMAELGL